jgi:hypothetical protein
MHTYTGNRLKIGRGGFVPTLGDIAFGLSRFRRWGGATIREWNVLQHSLAIFVLTEGEPLIVRSAALFHDVEEFITGDIPRGFKTAEQEIQGDELRKWIYKHVIKLPYPDLTTLGRVKVLDDVIALAESNCLNHPRIRRSMVPDWSAQVNATDPAVVERAEDVVWDLVDLEIREGVHLFVSTAEALLSAPEMKAMSARA